MAGTQDILRRLEKEKDSLKRAYGVKSLGVFGSWARGEAARRRGGEAAKQLPDDLRW